MTSKSTEGSKKNSEQELLEACKNTKLNEKYNQIGKIETSFLDYVVTTFGRKCTLNILLELKNCKKFSFREIQRKLNISPSTLSILLKRLHKEGLISREVFGEIPPLRVEYRITKNGLNLLVALHPLLSWIKQRN